MPTRTHARCFRPWVSPRTLAGWLAPLAVVLLAAACDEVEDGDAGTGGCGPSEATVVRIVDGDTVELDTGDIVRYLLVDTPETTQGNDDCWGVEAREANRSFVEGQTVTLDYDVECTDRFGRLLAYVSVGDRVINELMVERGHACVLHIPPNGEETVEDYLALEAAARSAGRGVWGACDPVTCQ